MDRCRKAFYKEQPPGTLGGFLVVIFLLMGLLAPRVGTVRSK